MEQLHHHHHQQHVDPFVKLDLERIRIQLQQQQQQQGIALENQDPILDELILLSHGTQQTDTMVQTNRDLYQNFVIQLQLRARTQAEIRGMEAAQAQYNMQPTAELEERKRNLSNIEIGLRQRAVDLNRLRLRCVSSFSEIFCRMLKTQNKILYDLLPKWHREQQLVNNGVVIETITLNCIQVWIEKIVDITWRLKNQVKCLQLTLTDQPNVPFNTEELDRFVVDINKSLENLILNAFVVEKQPPQVMKTNTRFTSTVRFLCGNKLNVQLINPIVKATILSESNARSIIRQHKRLIQSSWSNLDHYMPSPESTTMVMSPKQQSLTPSPVVAGTNLVQSSTDLHHPHPQQHHHHHHQQQQQHQQHHKQQHSIYASVDTQSQSPEQQDQIMADQIVPSSAHQQQFFQQQQHQQPLQQVPQQQIYHQIGATNMTAQPYGVTYIGYNPNIPCKEHEPSGEILNNSQVLEHHDATGQMVSHFRNMQLKKIKRTEKKGTESVMDEKFVLLFSTEFRIADDSFWPYCVKKASRIKRGDLVFQMLAFSLPVVVTVHGNQESHAWATVTWHNAFATPDELLYQVPDKVPWRELGHVLSEKFRSCAGRGMNEQNLRYLASKLYRARVDSDDVLVSWNQFAKEPLPDRTFTFWEWFHSILKLTKEHLKDLWNADRIYGFIGKDGCVNLLLGSYTELPKEVGTFLLRYSETELGGITIAWVSSSDGTNECDQYQISQRNSPTNSSSLVVKHLQPFVSKDLHTRSLADRIRDLCDLVYLYPTIPKDDAFKTYYTPLNETTLLQNGYIRPMLIQTLAKNYPKNATNPNDCQSVTPVTPSSFSQSSPERIYQDNGLTVDMDASYPSYDVDFNSYTIP